MSLWAQPASAQALTVLYQAPNISWESVSKSEVSGSGNPLKSIREEGPPVSAATDRRPPPHLKAQGGPAGPQSGLQGAPVSIPRLSIEAVSVGRILHPGFQALG